MPTCHLETAPNNLFCFSMSLMRYEHNILLYFKKQSSAMSWQGLVFFQTLAQMRQHFRRPNRRIYKRCMEKHDVFFRKHSMDSTLRGPLTVFLSRVWLSYRQAIMIETDMCHYYIKFAYNNIFITSHHEHTSHHAHKFGLQCMIIIQMKQTTKRYILSIADSMNVHLILRLLSYSATIIVVCSKIISFNVGYKRVP